MPVLLEVVEKALGDLGGLHSVGPRGQARRPPCGGLRLRGSVGEHLAAFSAASTARMPHLAASTPDAASLRRHSAAAAIARRTSAAASRASMRRRLLLAIGIADAVGELADARIDLCEQLMACAGPC